MNELLALPYSPWSEKARWALDVRGVPYRYRHYQPLLGELGVRRTLRKYRAHERSSSEHRVKLRAVLEELRAALAASSLTPKTLLGAFSFADIAAAQILGFVSPPSSGLKLGKASARGFTDPELSREFADLIAWRDALYAAYRAPKA
jgi:glutathione S-transferase